MLLNSDDKCPVCKKGFSPQDDIVICPECGTPHHRECYNKLDHCFNDDKHGSGFEYTAGGKSAGQANTAPDTDAGHYYVPPSERSADKEENGGRYGKNDKKICPRCKASIEADAEFCSHCGARQDAGSSAGAPFGTPFVDLNSNAYDNDSRTVDGKSVSDVAAAVRTNAEKFIPKFIKNKKISWNWSAFIFGPYYLFFRKMYKHGVIFMALSLIARLIINGFFSKEIADYMSFFSSNAEALYTNPTQQLMNQFYDKAYDTVLPVMLITIGVGLVLHIIIALFADSFYRSKIIALIDKVDKNIEDGASFSAAPIFDSPSLSQSDMRRIYLGRTGGTNFFAPVMAFFILDLITSLISYI